METKCLICTVSSPPAEKGILLESCERNDYQPIVRLWEPLSCRLREKSPADCRQIILHYLNKRGKGTKKSWNDEIIKQLFSLPKGFLDEGSDFHHILLDKCNSTPRQLLVNSWSTPIRLSSTKSRFYHSHSHSSCRLRQFPLVWK